MARSEVVWFQPARLCSTVPREDGNKRGDGESVSGRARFDRLVLVEHVNNSECI